MLSDYYSDCIDNNSNHEVKQTGKKSQLGHFECQTKRYVLHLANQKYVIGAYSVWLIDTLL